MRRAAVAAGLLLVAVTALIAVLTFLYGSLIIALWLFGNISQGFRAPDLLAGIDGIPLVPAGLALALPAALWIYGSWRVGRRLWRRFWRVGESLQGGA